jgi:hypothetical protein
VGELVVADETENLDLSQPETSDQIRATIVALHENFAVLDAAIAGRLNMRGTWDAEDTYRANDVVVHEGSLWLAVNPTDGEVPSELNPFSFYTFDAWVSVPAIAAHSEAGRRISHLVAYQGRLYPEYGDYFSNNGPVDLVGVDIDDGELHSEHDDFSAERVRYIETSDGRLWALGIDPRGAPSPEADFAVRDAGSDEWTPFYTLPRPPGGLVYLVTDLAELNGALYLCGQAGEEEAYVWKSVDGGVTWTTDLTVGTESGAPGTWATFWNFVRHGDRLWVVAQDSDNYPPQTVGHYLEAGGDGTWVESAVDVPNVGSGGGANIVLAGYSFVLRDGLSGYGGMLTRFDGSETTSWVLDTRVQDLSVGGGYLWALTTELGVFRTVDGETWDHVCSGPGDGTSILYLDGYLYAGTVGGDIVRRALADLSFTTPWRVLSAVQPRAIGPASHGEDMIGFYLENVSVGDGISYGYPATSPMFEEGDIYFGDGDPSGAYGGRGTIVLEPTLWEVFAQASFAENATGLRGIGISNGGDVDHDRIMEPAVAGDTTYVQIKRIIAIWPGEVNATVHLYQTSGGNLVAEWVQAEFTRVG